MSMDNMENKTNEGITTDNALQDLDLDALLQICSELTETNDCGRNDGGNSADEVHNSACDLARRGKKKEAAALCMDALNQFPRNVDLLADTIKYSADIGDLNTARRYYCQLKKCIPVSVWNWRAFTFSFDYLLEEDVAKNETECRELVANYKKFLPYEERAWMCESELEEALGNREASISALESAISTHTNAAQCALRLADIQLDRGMFEEAAKTASYGIAAAATPQPTINIPYLCLIRTLAQDHFLQMKAAQGENISSEEVSVIDNEYKSLEEFVEMAYHLHTIKDRQKLLKFIHTC